MVSTAPHTISVGISGACHEAMTVRIYYDTPDGVDMVERDERQYKDGVVTAYDNPRDENGIFRKVEIPTDRVIQVTHDEQEWSE